MKLCVCVCFFFATNLYTHLEARCTANSSQVGDLLGLLNHTGGTVPKRLPSEQIKAWLNLNFPAIKLMLKYVVYVNAFEFRHTRCVSRFVSHSGILACPAAPPGLRDSFMSPLYRSVPFRSLPPSAVSADGLHRTREVRRLPPRASFVNVEASTSICVCVFCANFKSGNTSRHFSIVVSWDWRNYWAKKWFITAVVGVVQSSDFLRRL